MKSTKKEVEGRGEMELEEFREYLLERGYDKGHVGRVVSTLNKVLEAGGLEAAETQTVSPHMRRKMRYAWRRYEEFLQARRARAGGNV